MAKERTSSAASKQTHEIAEAVRNVEIVDTEAWPKLDSLSSKTLVEAVEVFEDEIRFDGTRFVGPINVHVTLQYAKDVTLSETFPGRFEARWKGDAPSIDRLLVDTSSFTR